MSHTMITKLLVPIALGSLTAGCDLDVGDLNNPGIDELATHPTRTTIDAACTGLLIGNRSGFSTEIGYIMQLGVLGREAYNFDSADPRYVGELLAGTLQKGSPFGGAFWTLPYRNIRLENLILDSVDKVADLSDTETSGIRGFTRTIEAIDLERVILTHDDNGAVIDTDHALGDPLPPIVDKATAYAKIAELLDDGATELDAAGDAFSFPLSAGYEGFDTPATFKKLNRAIRAQVAAYTGDYAHALTALADSFIDPTGDLDAGVYYVYSTSTGDATNELVNPNIFAHPSVKTDAQMNGATPDARLTRKVMMTARSGSEQGLTSDLVFTLYSTPTSKAPLIRNEELLLLKAEAQFFTSDVAGAVTTLNIVRTQSGGLPALAGTPTMSQFVDDLLYERRYSLLFEGGHRWIDLRRFGRTADLPLDMPDFVRNVRYPIPLDECNARPGEPKCDGGST